MAKKPSTGKARAGKQAKSAIAAEPPPETSVAEDAPVESVENAAVADPPETETIVVPDDSAETLPPAGEDPPHGDLLHDDELEEDHHSDDHGSPLSRKLLTGLLLLIAGAGLALWGAPKLAPMVPSGLAPVARWLAPGEGNARDDIAALRAELAERLSSLPVPVSEARIEEIAQAVTGPATDALTGRVNELSDQAAAGDMGAIQARLAATETRLQGLATEISSLSEQLSNSTIGNGEMTAETAGQIAGYRASVDGLRAEIEALSSRQGELSHRVDAVGATTTRQMEEAQATLAAAEAEAALKSGLAGVRAALAAGVPFKPALADLRAASGQPLPTALMDAAAEGVPALQSLRDGFPDVAHAAIAASINASAGEGTLSRLGAFLESRVATRSLIPQEGMTPDAILSRMEGALKVDDLATVLAEAEALPSEATAIMADWLARTERRHAATDAFARLSAALAPSN